MFSVFSSSTYYSQADHQVLFSARFSCTKRKVKGGKTSTDKVVIKKPIVSVPVKFLVMVTKPQNSNSS